MPARETHLPCVHFLRLDVTYADFGAGAQTIGTIPAGSLILKSESGVNVSTAFDSSGTDLLDIGTTADDDLYATDLSLASAGWQALDESVSMYVAAETTLTATLAQSAADATAGVAQIVIAYIPNNGNNTPNL